VMGLTRTAGVLLYYRKKCDQASEITRKQLRDEAGCWNSAKRCRQASPQLRTG